MSASNNTYSSVRRSLQHSFSARDLEDEDRNKCPKVPRVSPDLIQLLQVLSFHKVKHLSVPLLAGFHRGSALGNGASFNVKEFALPIDLASIPLPIRDLTDSGREDAYFKDFTNERWATQAKGAYKSVSSTVYLELIRELRVLCHPPLQDFVVRLAGLAWIARPTPKGENIPEEIPAIVVERAPRGSLHDFMQSEDWISSRVSLKAKFRICVRVLRCIAVGVPKPIDPWHHRADQSRHSTHAASSMLISRPPTFSFTEFKTHIRKIGELSCQTLETLF